MTDLAPAVREDIVRALGDRIRSLRLLAGGRIIADLDVVPPALVAAGQWTASAATTWATDSGRATTFQCLDVSGVPLASGAVGVDCILSDPDIVAGDAVDVTVTVGWA